MKKFKKRSFLAFFSALLFTFLFFEKSWGLNILLFHTFILSALSFTAKEKFSDFQWLLFGGSVISVITTFYYHSLWSLYVSWGSIFLYSIALYSNKLKSFHLLFTSFFWNLLGGWRNYLKESTFVLDKTGFPVKRVGKLLKYLIPVLVVIIFLTIYSNANPSFANLTIWLSDFVEKAFDYLWQYLNIRLIFFFVFGLAICIPLFYPKVMDYLVKEDAESTNVLMRKRKKRTTSILGLSQELKVGNLLMLTLNLCIAALLFFEIRDVWFGFTWNGEFLKEFVHHGIALLIVSILISMVVALYFFRGNQNFFTKSQMLKISTYVWLGLNTILALSVLVRNYYYIEHFVLAYKRIGVVFFIVAVIVGLLTITLKIAKTYNLNYLVRVNSISAYSILVFICLFNWDVLIAKYNLARTNQSFVHLNFLIDLEDKALPYLDTSPEELMNMELTYKRKLKMSSDDFYDQYLDAATFEERLISRKERFRTKWEQKDLLEWNPSDARAYKLLIN